MLPHNSGPTASCPPPPYHLLLLTSNRHPPSPPPQPPPASCRPPSALPTQVLQRPVGAGPGGTEVDPCWFPRLGPLPALRLPDVCGGGHPVCVWRLQQGGWVGGWVGVPGGRCSQGGVARNEMPVCATAYASARCGQGFARCNVSKFVCHAHPRNHLSTPPPYVTATHPSALWM
jgi:hypothetical protein